MLHIGKSARDIHQEFLHRENLKNKVLKGTNTTK